MEVEAEDAIVVASDGEESSGRRQRRLRKPSTKAKQNEENQSSIDTVLLSPRSYAGLASRITTPSGTQHDEIGGDENTMPQTLQDQMNEQTGILKILLEAWSKQEGHNKAIKAELGRVKDELKAVKDELNQTKQEMVEAMAALNLGQSSPSLSYADVARTPPMSQPSNVQTLSSIYTTPSTLTNTLYCTIDTSRVEPDAVEQTSAGAIRKVVESGIRSEQEGSAWRCQGVTKDPRNPYRIRIACRSEAEHKQVKRVLETNLTKGARIMRDDLYPIRVDSVNRTAVLDEAGNVRPETAETLGKENDTQVAKVAWLSNRDIPKAYGSMVVYLSKRSDAQRFLHEGFFSARGESGYTKAFERRERPKQCYNCQEITDHKAYQCTRTQICAKCAKEGHHHSACTEAITKCAICGGPHEAFSRSCRKLYPSQHE
jgi:hypothetical protein